jgi:hypothetical protein
MSLKNFLLTLMVATAGLSATPAQETRRATEPGTAAGTPTNAVPDLRALLSPPQDGMRAVAARYEADRANLTRYYAVASPTRSARMKLFYNDWLAALGKLDSARLSQEGRDELTRLKETLQRELQQLDVQAGAAAEIAPVVPFAPVIINLEESRRRMETMDAAKAAGIVNDLKQQIDQARKAAGTGVAPALARRAAETVTTLRTNLRNWFGFYNDYDPLFTWWMAQPCKEADAALKDYATLLREKAGSEQTGSQNAVTAPARKDLPTAAIKLVGKEPDVPDLR